MALDNYRQNQDNDVRLVDFLDDKLQAFADFDTLDSLLDTVKAQQDLLKQQVRRGERYTLFVAFSDHSHSSMTPVTTTASPSKPRVSMPLL
jgi:predicted AlkP superfamily pyrophosphatase or phosphodiesterase